MATLLEHFNADFQELSLDRPVTFTKYQNDSNESIPIENFEVKERIRIQANSSVRYFTYYIPVCREPFDLIIALLNNLKNQVLSANEFEVIASFTGDKTAGKHTHQYSTRIYFYTETPLLESDIESLNELCTNSGLYITIRSQDYIRTKMNITKPLGFISHDSRDKDLIARPLALGLQSRLCSVWYDEYTLKVGDSLRESIENGIKETKKCILILTPNFLSNPGWGKKEFNSIFTREMIFNERVILPIWYGVSVKDIYNYSPSLADTFALYWPSNQSLESNEYKQQVEMVISKIHTQLTS